MELKNIKKNLQKTVKAIRDDINATKDRPSDFPKAMMTNQQMEKNTATVNCGGEWANAKTSMERVNAVMNDARFAKFLAECGATAKVEPTPFGSYQIRINY